MSKDKTWSGRFNEPVSELVKKYTGSIDFDKRLAEWDIQGSLAHAQMLTQSGVLSEDDLSAIRQGMAEIIAEIKEGTISWSLDLEDVHMNIERRLTDKIGDAGKRLHTGRSRNDQVATDIRLWLRAQITVIQGLIQNLQTALVDLAEQNAETVMPGFTHLQVAQPVSFGHHMLAYVEMLGRDFERMADCRKRVNRMPLGAAALAAVSDRDFAIEFTAAASLIMVHLSRLSEELILWMSPRFGFIDIADRFCTGSSIMPQKKNPDVPELVRGKSGRVIGHLIGLVTLMKSQPLAYNKDNQEDKEPLFDTADTLIDTLRIYADMMRGVTVKPDNMRAAVMQGFATATDLADYLVKKGMPFRDSHEVVAQAVRHADEAGVDLSELPLKVLQGFSGLIAEDVYTVLTPEGSLNARNHLGGTAPEQVRFQVKRWRELLA